VEPRNRDPIALTAYLGKFFTISESHALHVSGDRFVPGRDSVPFEPSRPIRRYKPLPVAVWIGGLQIPVPRDDLCCVNGLFRRQVVRWSYHGQSLTSAAPR
jgi:hypothetical protein